MAGDGHAANGIVLRQRHQRTSRAQGWSRASRQQGVAADDQRHAPPNQLLAVFERDAGVIARASMHKNNVINRRRSLGERQCVERRS